MRVAIFCLAGVALLGACSKAPTASTASASATAPAAPAAAAAPAAPGLFERPHPKAGLWEMAMTSNAGPGVSFTSQVCIDASTEGSAFQGGGPRSVSKACGDQKISAAPGGGFAMDATCKADGRTITTHMVASGDFNSAYTLDMTSQMDPAPPGFSGGMHTQVKARWLGACKPGQAPGHRTMTAGGLG
jgi:hypothetical protein